MQYKEEKSCYKVDITKNYKSVKIMADTEEEAIAHVKKYYQVYGETTELIITATDITNNSEGKNNEQE
tara:strand:+ start:311 stop:514 length:204 start_codon:yes stop_codon:yes gene_type:complete